MWNPNGVKFLGTPIGVDTFVETVGEKRLQEEMKLWEAISWVPDVQCGWQILLQCAGPRCHHFLRTIPPNRSTLYAACHDEGMMKVMDEVLGGLLGDNAQKATAERIASLPMRLGGLGLRSAKRMAPAAYWASWADALSMLSERLPHIADLVVDQMADGAPLDGCLGELCKATEILDRSGFVGRPEWGDLRAGARPPVPESPELGEWQHGWQYHASSSLEHRFRETVSQSCAADQASLCPHSGPGASSTLHGSPTSVEFKLDQHVFRTIVLERLRLPLDLMCECGARLDVWGHLRRACPRSGRLRVRATAPERTLARMCRETGARVRWQARLRDMNVRPHVRVLMNARVDHREAQALLCQTHGIRSRSRNACLDSIFTRATGPPEQCGAGATEQVEIAS